MKLDSTILSKELRVAVEIRRAENEGDIPVHFNKLVERLGNQVTGISRSTLSRALDMLFDQGIVRAEWVSREDGRHVRKLSIAGEARDFIKKLDENLK